MEFPPPNPKKRLFPGGSSSSMDAEIPRPTSRRKEVIHHEVVDVDMDEDCGDVMLIGTPTHGPVSGGAGYYISLELLGTMQSPFGINSWAAMQSPFGSFHSTSYMPFGTSTTMSALPLGSMDGVQSSKKSCAPGGGILPSGLKPFQFGQLAAHGKRKISVSGGAGYYISHELQLFKKFDTVEDHSDHYYLHSDSSSEQPSKNWAEKIQEEWKILEKDLPDTIYVRVYESRMDLLRAVIVGPEGTPYHDGLFFFDVFFPSSYPKVPPHVYYHSGGLRINPNLYDCGKVCLGLLNTWNGDQQEKWIPGVSTMLQVLVSIQGLILNAKPFFNEPAYANMRGSASGEKISLLYNKNTFILSLTMMVHSMRQPPKHFEDLVVGHFCKCARDILVACKAYMDGAQVGSLVRGGVQDVDEGDDSCSQDFKQTLAIHIKLLVEAFAQVGAKG